MSSQKQILYTTKCWSSTKTTTRYTKNVSSSRLEFDDRLKNVSSVFFQVSPLAHRWLLQQWEERIGNKSSNRLNSIFWITIFKIGDAPMDRSECFWRFFVAANNHIFRRNFFFLLESVNRKISTQWRFLSTLPTPFKVSYVSTIW